jgi:hypothetical protein
MSGEKNWFPQEGQGILIRKRYGDVALGKALGCCGQGSFVSIEATRLGYTMAEETVAPEGPWLWQSPGSCCPQTRRGRVGSGEWGGF